MERPFCVSQGPNVDQGANLALWTETVWFPSLWITGPRARCEPVDDDTALSFAPFREGEKPFLVRFDPDSGQLRIMESIHHTDPTSDR